MSVIVYKVGYTLATANAPTATIATTAAAAVLWRHTAELLSIKVVWQEFL